MNLITMRLLQKSLIAGFLSIFIVSLAAENLFAQYFFFGKNRVQYEQFDWRYIETDHFDIYYYDSKNYHLAQFTAETLESSLKQLNQDFGDQLTDRIPVIIYDSHSDFSQTNVVRLPVDAQGIGGVTDKFKNRMTQPFMGDYADFRRTLQHELTHAYINDVYYGGSVQSIVQNNIQLRFPLWFEEGLAEYLALGWDTQTDMFMRDAVLNQYLPPITQLSGFFAYRGGQAFWYYIADQYGRPKITEILQRIKTTRNIQQSLVQSLGLEIDELSDRWLEYWRQRYFPEVADRQSLNSVATQITTRARSGSYNTSPTISPRGDRIAMITNRRGVFDIVVVDANSGERLKTLVSSADNPMFEELNILIPNLSWSPDGTRLALSSKSEGTYNLAIVEYESGNSRTIKFPDVDAINSVAWSPDGRKIAFDGNIGPYQDIFVYNLETGDFQNLTNDVYSDNDPEWGPDSETIFFVSNRSDKLQPGDALAGFSILQDAEFYETDLYRINDSGGRITRLTNTPSWSETQPTVTSDGRMLFVSDQNGIPNVYEYELASRTVYPITDLQSGVMQVSVSNDGTRLAFNSLNRGFPDIFMLRGPFERRMDRQLRPNQWAQERASTAPGDRVPAVEFAQEMIDNRERGNMISYRTLTDAPPTGFERMIEAAPDTTNQDTVRAERPQTERIDFRNYQFGESVVRDSTIELTDDPEKFEPDDNVTDEGLYQPKEYRLRFTPDFSYAAGQLSTYYGSSAFAFVTLTDLFGDHELSFGSNLVFDLRNSDYTVQYAYKKNRTNFFTSFFHQSRNYQTFFGELLRFRTFGFSVDFQYPLNRFQRFDYGISGIGIARDFSSVQSFGDATLSNDRSYFLYPQVTFTGDYTIPGFITPRGGSRYSLQLSASPPLGPETPQFATLLGDYRKYIDLGSQYSIALRGAGAVSHGRDSQTFFMGGMLGWINQQWSDAEIPFERLADTFFTLPATPLRGHEFNTIFGDRFSLINAEFRFPLFAAVLPGPLPILPLWNITAVAFVDAGAAWGFDIPYARFSDQNGNPVVYFENQSDLDFKIGNKRNEFLNPQTGLLRDGPAQEGDIPVTFVDGDVLIGAGFGLRTILLGLPFRYDIGWPYQRGGFGGNPIHYFTIGIDF
ncbi:peptidase MA family metallohydrolase [Rhodohalobacter mucosus]|uniref:peptidase MA family metallohydrolase n=1 Tax=Rhodohalobacter mucosus TaxID=2079485 RepID=UPI001FA8490A|nr:BamA/TamA family outer membrane protein [Rhodohalobacter mucosus]